MSGGRKLPPAFRRWSAFQRVWRITTGCLPTSQARGVGGDFTLSSGRPHKWGTPRRGPRGDKAECCIHSITDPREEEKDGRTKAWIDMHEPAYVNISHGQGKKKLSTHAHTLWSRDWIRKMDTFWWLQNTKQSGKPLRGRHRSQEDRGNSEAAFYPVSLWAKEKWDKALISSKNALKEGHGQVPVRFRQFGFTDILFDQSRQLAPLGGVRQGNRPGIYWVAVWEEKRRRLLQKKSQFCTKLSMAACLSESSCNRGFYYASRCCCIWTSFYETLLCMLMMSYLIC